MNLQGKTNQELIQIRDELEANPANQTPPGSFYRVNEKTRKKINNINEYITHNLAMARAAAGNPVPCDGYSGRKCKRRR